MVRYLHQLSAILFYVLGLSFFLGYVLTRNGIAPDATTTWLQMADMPLLLIAILYGGLSVYKSLHDEAKGTSTILAVAIGLPLMLIFLAFLSLNFGAF